MVLADSLNPGESSCDNDQNRFETLGYKNLRVYTIKETSIMN